MSRHHGVADALADLADRTHLEQEGPHVAFVLTVDGVDLPELWVAVGGVARRFADLKFSRSAQESRGEWSWNDIEDASNALHDIVQWFRIYQNDLETAVFHAIDKAKMMRERRSDNILRRELDTAAHERAHPFVCDCKRRFATERGLAMHQARSRLHARSAS